MSETVQKESEPLVPRDETACGGFRWRTVALVSVAVVLCIILGVLAGVLIHTKHEWTQLEDAVRVENIMPRLRVLQDIAKDANNSRSPLNGYSASAQYLERELVDHVSCSVSKQTFPSIQTREVKPPRLFVDSSEMQYGVDFAGMRYGGNGDFDITARTVPVMGRGCNASDYTDVAKGDLALVLVDNGPMDCSLYEKGVLAQEAGAAGLLLRNDFSVTRLQSARVRLPGYTPGDVLVSIPVLSLSYSMGIRIMSSQVTVRIIVHTRIDQFSSFNTCCESHTGDPTRVFIAGAHLDSVSAGPGINDDGSGAMSLLEMAVQWTAIGLQPVNRVRFCWWGSEEEGLIGSRYYVSQLNATERARIAGYINMDMLGSPNFVRSVYRGSDAMPVARHYSSIMEATLTDYFERHKLAYELTPMVAGSDFVPFMEAGIATTGVLTGAGATKTDAQRAKFGGLANAPLDPCYHAACDTVDNVDPVVLQDMARAAAHGLYRLAYTTDLEKL